MSRRGIIVSLLTLIWLALGLSLWLLPQAPTAVGQANERQVIKNGEVVLQVGDVDTAVDNTLSLGQSFGAYVLEQEIWQDQEHHRYATITFGLPHGEFEALLLAVKRLGMLENESLSGRDVRDNITDLNSQLNNLHETRLRLRVFLEQTETMTDTFTVHDRLRNIESDIEALQGQYNLLTGRSQAATLTVRLQPIVPTPTPTPTLTPTPLPEPVTWRPGDTAQTAATDLQNSAQRTADFFIFQGIVCGPWLLLLGLLGWGGWRIRRRLKPKG